MKKYLLLLLAFLSPTLSLLFAQDNLKAEYFNGINFDEYVGTHFVSNIDFYWNQRAPIQGLNPHYCSVLYTGQLKTPRTGDVTFSARVDDGIRVWIDDILLISNWQLNDVGYSEGTIHLNANTNYTIKINYFNALNEAEIRLLWKLPEDPDQSWLSSWWYGNDPVVIPSEYFMPSIEEVVIEEPKPQPIAESKPAPKPKKKPTPKPKPIPKKEPIVVTPPKKSMDTIQKYIPKNIEFERAKSEILEVSYPDLDKLALFLKNNPNRKVKIEGHTDNVGDTSKNLILSERRAKAIAAYLVKNGVHYQQIISAKGYGGSRPIAQSDGRKYHPENRRVEFIIE